VRQDRPKYCLPSPIKKKIGDGTTHGLSFFMQSKMSVDEPDKITSHNMSSMHKVFTPQYAAAYITAH